MRFAGSWDRPRQGTVPTIAGNFRGVPGPERPAGACVFMAPTAWSGNLALLRCSAFALSSQIPSSSPLSLPAACFLGIGEHVTGLIIIAVALFSVAPEVLDGIPDTNMPWRIQKQIATTAAVLGMDKNRNCRLPS